jgi:hypothetical protein
VNLADRPASGDLRAADAAPPDARTCRALRTVPATSSLIHPTYKHLGREIRLAGLTLTQWSLLVVAGVTAYGISKILPFSDTYNLSVAIAIAGAPAAATFAGATGDVHLFSFLRAVIRWRRSAAVYSAKTLLPIRSLSEDGLLTRTDGTLVRYLQVVPTNPLVADDDGCERMTRGLTDLIQRIPAGTGIQCYVEATPIALDDLLARHRRETDTATAPAPPATRDALRRLAEAHAASLRLHAENQAALDVRFVLIVPSPGAADEDAQAATHARAERESRQLTERLRSALVGVDMKANVMDGAAVGALLAGRVGEDGASTVDTTDRRRLTVAGAFEQTIHLSRIPERTFYGWLLHAMQSPRPWALSVHLHARDRIEDRDRENRRARRLWGVNEGAADRRARPDRQQHDQQDELESLVDELGSGAQRLVDLAVYQTIRADAADDLAEAIEAARRDLGAVVDAGVGAGDARQLPLWLSALPLGLDQAHQTVRMISRNAADTIPFVSTSCGSPGGVPLGFAEPGRTLECLHPFDRTHDNSTMLLIAKSGGGKTMTAITVTSDAMTRGCQLNVIDRSPGHYRYLADAIPGCAHLEIGDEHTTTTINPWDVEDRFVVPRSKVAFLVRLHALLIGDHDAEADSYGLGSLERNLLAIAIRHVYATTGNPRESALHAALLDLASREDDDTAAVYRNLAHRLGEFCEDGTYGYLFDRTTSVDAADAPLAVFNTRQIPEDVSAAVLFTVLEFITQRVERRFAAHQRRLADGHTAAGEFDGTSAVVIEELWKLTERRATAAWVNELVKRARHIGLWFIAITQQRTDLAGPQGRALLDNSTMQVFLRNGPDDIAHIADALSFSDAEIDQISRLTTEKGSHAEAYVVNGERGRGAITIRVGPHIYWLATSEPLQDVPLRNLALQEADGDHFAALDLLAEPDWHAGLATR